MQSLLLCAKFLVSTAGYSCHPCLGTVLADLHMQGTRGSILLERVEKVDLGEDGRMAVDVLEDVLEAMEHLNHDDSDTVDCTSSSGVEIRCCASTGVMQGQSGRTIDARHSYTQQLVLLCGPARATGARPLL